MNTLNKAKRVIPGLLLCAAFTMFFCVQHRSDDNVLNWVDFDTIPPVITLLGDNPYTIVKDSSYIEYGATAYDSVDGNLTSSILIDTSDVDTNTIGTYQVVYTVSDDAGNEASENRTVQVVNEIADTSGPVITLLGPDPYPMNIGDTYFEAGATAYDSADGVLTSDIIIDNSAIDELMEGDYTATYTVTDSDAKTAVATRTVQVKDSEGTDKEKPELRLEGDNPFYLLVGDTYVDPGATAIDNNDGNITYKILKYDISINTASVDTHAVYFVVSDVAGNVAMKIRTVIVITSIVDTTPPVITLLGPNPVNLTVGDAYTEPGATAYDSVDGDITIEIVITGSVDTSTEGIYTVRYNVSDNAGNAAEEKTRTVNVLSGNDVTKPVITLKGANPMTLEIGDTYNEPGATAVDDVDGNITSDIQITGTVNTNTIGDYTITYSVSDNAGNPASKTRTVKVVSQIVPDWETGIQYQVGDLVTYNAQIYRCISAHTSQAGWEPTNAPVLWDLQ